MCFFSPKGCSSTWEWGCCPVRMREACSVTAHTGSACGVTMCVVPAQGTTRHFPELPAQHLPTTVKLSALAGENKERQDSLIIILCSSSCQVTHQAVVKHVRPAKSHHVISFGGSRSRHVCQMTEQIWHLKTCQLCPWTILEKKQTKLTQTLPSSWLQSSVIIFLQIFVCNVIFSSLSSSDLSCGSFSHLQCQWWERKSKTAVLGHMTCHRDPDPSVNLGRLHIFKLQPLHMITKVWREPLLHLMTKALGMLVHPPSA